MSRLAHLTSKWTSHNTLLGSEVLPGSGDGDNATANRGASCRVAGSRPLAALQPGPPSYCRLNCPWFLVCTRSNLSKMCLSMQHAPLHFDVSEIRLVLSALPSLKSWLKLWEANGSVCVCFAVCALYAHRNITTRLQPASLLTTQSYVDKLGVTGFPLETFQPHQNPGFQPHQNPSGFDKNSFGTNKI
jgi:hypothetical protein